MAKQKQKQSDFAQKAAEIKENILSDIENIDLGVNDFNARKTNINLIYKIRAGVNAARFSGERDLGITLSSSKNIKGVLEKLNKLSSIMEYMLTQIMFLSKNGETDQAMEMIQEQAKLQAEIDKAEEGFEKIIDTYLQKGYARRALIQEYNDEKEAEKVKNLVEDYQKGMKPSELVKKYELSAEVVSSKCSQYRVNYLEANKKEIEKLFLKEQNLAQLAETFEVKTKNVRAALVEWSKSDEKLSKVLNAYFEGEQAKKEATQEEPLKADETEKTA